MPFFGRQRSRMRSGDIDRLSLFETVVSMTIDLTMYRGTLDIGDFVAQELRAEIDRPLSVGVVGP